MFKRINNIEFYNDTPQYYAARAHDESMKINYIHGIAEALSLKAEIASAGDNYTAEETLSRQAINWYRKTSNKKKLAEAYLNLGFSMFTQSSFEEAAKNLDTANELGTFTFWCGLRRKW